MNEASRPKVGLFHPWMSFGGSEAVVMHLAEALAPHCALDLITSSPVDLKALNDAFGTSVDESAITVRRAPAFPGVRHGTQLAHLQRRYFTRFARRVAGEYDVLVSGHNPLPFGRPAVHLVADFGWDDEARAALFGAGENEPKRHQKSLMRAAYLGLGKLLAPGASASLFRSEHDLFLANSNWTSGYLQDRYKVEEDRVRVVYPPVPSPPPAIGDELRDALSFVYLGRVSQEKRVLDAISIVEAIREKGTPATLRVVGPDDGGAYAAEVAARCESSGGWAAREGRVGPAEKWALLRSANFGISPCRGEAFGIAAAEMAAAGCIPFVSDVGGAGEVVGDERLIYSSIDDAASKAVEVVGMGESGLESLRNQLIDRVVAFSPDHFAAAAIELILAFKPSR